MKGLLYIFTSLILITACNNNNNNYEPDLTEGITGLYIGSINVGTPAFQNTSYSVTISKVSNNRIRFTPSTNDASTWETDIMKPTAGTITCTSCGINQVAMVIANSSVNLSYNYNSNEQFAGSK